MTYSKLVTLTNTCNTDNIAMLLVALFNLHQDSRAWIEYFASNNIQIDDITRHKELVVNVPGCDLTYNDISN